MMPKHIVFFLLGLVFLSSSIAIINASDYNAKIKQDKLSIFNLKIPYYEDSSNKMSALSDDELEVIHDLKNSYILISDKFFDFNKKNFNETKVNNINILMDYYVEKINKTNNILPFFNSKMTTSENSVIMNSLLTEDKINVIIHLKDPFELWPNEISAMSNKDINNLKAEMREYSINKLGKNVVKYKFDSFNGFSANITSLQYLEMLKNPLIEKIEENTKVQASLYESDIIIGANEVWSYQVEGESLTGQGQTVCVVDTGIDYTHPDLGGCSLSDVPGIIESYTLDPSVPNPYPNDYNNTWIITKSGYEQISVFFEYVNIENYFDEIYVYDQNDTLFEVLTGNFQGWSEIVPGDTIKIQFVTDVSINGENGYLGFNINATKNISLSQEVDLWENCNKVIGGYDFVNLDYNPLDDEGHGTHVAGIIAANGSLKGVAPDAKLVAVKVLDEYGSGYTSDIIKGIEYCVENAQLYNISAISMSLGGSIQYNDYCDEDYASFSEAINSAVANNISVVIATGNNGNSSGISSPACIYNATRVSSSVKSDDALSIFSDRWALDMLVAPGSNIYSTYLGGGYLSQSGTSMATPHVSGAIALINQYYDKKSESVSPKEINNKLNQTGKIINQDGRIYSRIDLPTFFSDLNVDKYPSVTINYPYTAFSSPNNISVILSNFDIATSTCYFYLNDSFLDSVQANSSQVMLYADIPEGYYKLFVICNDSYTNESNATKFFNSGIAPKLLDFSINASVNSGENIIISSSWDNGLSGYISQANLFFVMNYINSSVPTTLYYDDIYGDTPAQFTYEGNITNILFNFSTFGFSGQNLSFGIKVKDNQELYNATYNYLDFITNDSDGSISNVIFYEDLKSQIIDNVSPELELYGYNNSFISTYEPLFFIGIDDNFFDNLTCSLYINEQYNQNKSVPILFFGIFLDYFELNLSEGEYNWSVSCEDASNNLGNSDIDYFKFNSAPSLLNISADNQINEGESIIINSTWDNGLFGQVNEGILIAIENYTEPFNLSYGEINFYNDSNGIIHRLYVTGDALIVNDSSLSNVSFIYAPNSNQTGMNMTFMMQVQDTYSSYNVTYDTINYFDENKTTFFVNPVITTYIKDITAPNINLNQLPSYSNNDSQIFYFNVSDNVEFKEVNCSFYLNNEYNQSKLIYPNSSAQFFNLDLADGDYNYSLSCIDYDLNQANQSYTTIIDTINPRLNIMSLNDGVYYINNTLLLNISAEDNNLDSVWYNFGGTNITYTSPVNVTFNENSNTLNVYSNDYAGNFNQTSITFTVDTIIPAINILNLNNGSYYNNATKLLNISVIEDNLDNVWYDIGGANITYISPLNITFNEGINNLTVYANDSASHFNQTSITFTIDTIAPQLVFNSISNDSWTNKQYTNVSYKFIDNTSLSSSCQLKVNDVNVYNSVLANNTLINYNYRNLNSINTYNFSCTDLASNYNSTTVTLKFDSANPITNASGYNLNIYGWSNENLNITLSAVDSLSGVNKIQFKNSTSQWIDYDYNLNITINFAGIIEYRSIDNAGNIEASKYLMLKVDKSNPIISSIYSSAAISSSNSIVRIEALANDALSGLLNASAKINGITYIMNYSAGKYYALITAPSIEGNYEINVTVFDKAYNHANSAINLTVSNALPITKLNLANSSIVLNNTQLTLEFLHSDNSSIIIGGIETNTSLDNYELTISGNDAFNFDVINYNANNQTINNYTYYIDALAPSVLINNLANNDNVNSTILINVSATDNYNLVNVSLLIDNVFYHSKTISPFLFYYPTTLLSDGLHNFTAVAYDSVGQSNNSNIMLNITNKVTVNLNVTGDVNLSSGELSRDGILGTNLDSVIYEITGLNSSAVNISLNEGNYSEGLSSTIGAININASTNANSEIYFLIPKIVLENNGLTNPYSEISVHAIHSNGQEQELSVTYDSLVLIEELEFERFKFTTTHYSTFYYGIDATCSDGLQNQFETGIDCGGPCSACPSNGDEDNNDNTNTNVYSPILGGSVSGVINTQNNETIVNNSKTYEFVNYNDQKISRAFEINKIVNLNVSGNNYSFEIASMNETYVYLNISNYGLLKLFVGTPKNITINNQNISIMLESISSGTASISFETLANTENLDNDEELENNPITAQIISNVIEDISSNKIVGYIILTITGIAAIILFVLKILRIL